MNQARLALQYGSNMPIRVALALASTFWCLGLTLVATHHGEQICRPMSDSHPDVWALVFALNALLLWWRIVDRKARPQIGRMINALTSALWLAITTATVIEAGFLAAAGAFTLFVMALWASFRTDLTTGDRETA